MPEEHSQTVNNAVSQHIASYWNAIHRKEARVKDLNINYLEAGEGPTVLLLHGFFGQRNHWRSVMVGLKKHFRIIAVEVPGFNLKHWLPREKHTLRALSDWLDAFADAIYVKSFHLVGYSSGACLAAYYAYTHANKVMSLSFISFPNIYLEEEKLFKNIFDECLYTQIKCAADIEGLWASLFYDPPKVPKYFQHVVYTTYKHRLPALTRLLQDMSDGTSMLLPRLRHIHCHVLAIRGEQDEHSSPEILNYLARTIPNFQHRQIQDAKHLCYVERYNETISILTTFIHAQREANPSLMTDSRIQRALKA